MKVIPVHEAEGAVLCHDITEIVPGKSKGRAFKKGHVVRKEDILKLLNLGKEHLYVWELTESLLHEDDAAIRIAKAVMGKGLYLTEPAEGKVELKTSIAGLLKVNFAALDEINNIDQIVVASLHSNRRVAARTAVAGCRVVPLVIDSDKILAVEEICRSRGPIIDIKPFRTMKAGLVTTGSEVYHHRIKDEFGPVVEAKVAGYGSRVIRQI